MDIVIKIIDAVAGLDGLGKLFVFGSILLLGIIQSLGFRTDLSLGAMVTGMVQGAFGYLLSFLMEYNIIVHSLLFAIPSLLIALIITPFISVDVKENEIGFEITYTAKKGKVKFKVNLKRGLAIFGAAGSGKTVTGFAPILKRMCTARLSGVVYDHKDGELWEFFMYFWLEHKKRYEDWKQMLTRGTDKEIKKAKKNPVNEPLPIYPICFHKPNLSYRVNPISPKYLTDMDDVKMLTTALMDNMSSESGSENAVFASGARAALNGVIWRLKSEFPEICHFPMAAAFMLQKSAEEIMDFIAKNDHARLLAAPFFDSEDNERLLASFKNSISDSLVGIISPKVFYVLSKDEVPLDLNNKENPRIMGMINTPDKAKAVYNPLMALIFETVKLQMCKRGQNESVMVLDEAGQIKFNDLFNIPALLRTYDIATVFGIQDKVQGEILYSEKQMKALNANLSSLMFGKANEPETAEFYEKFFEFVDVDQKSVSKRKGGSGMNGSSGGGTSETTSQKEVRKHRAFEFRQMGPGQFHVFDEKGDHKFHTWDYLECKPITIPNINHVTETEIEENFERILQQAKELS